MARFFTPIEDAHTDITNLDEPPSGIEPLPPDNIPYAYVDIAHDNFTNEDIVTAHATISVEKEWLSSTQVHQWSVQLSRFDPATTAWIPCPASTIFAGWRQSVLPVHLLGLDALLGSVGPVAGDVKLQDDGVVHDPVNRRGGGHGVGKDALPLGEDQV